MALFFAGTRPERTSALILADATARYLVADDYPIGFPSEQVELRGDVVGGIAVNIAARIMATAGAGEIVVSRTVPGCLPCWATYPASRPRRDMAIQTSRGVVDG